jgi:NADH-ubiquinone oxidoreductase chain 5
MLKLLLIIVFSTPLWIKNKWPETTIVILVGTIITSVNRCDKINPTNYYFFTNLDILSIVLIILSFWLSALIIIASTRINRNNFKPRWFLTLVRVLCVLLVATFSTCNIFLFYLLFEATLIPTVLLIIGWGYQPERLQAGLYILFYTLFASLPLLVTIFWVEATLGSLDFNLLILLKPLSLTPITGIAIVLAFLVKIPIFIVHLWLPKAHVEAPVRGSMILAGVLLKLGGYGLMRISPLFINKILSLNFIWIVLRIVGGSIVSFICLRQTDTKRLVAYSSVAHIGLVIGGIMVGSYSGIVGSLTLMVAHGLCSSAIFCLTNIIFERLGSRNLLVCRGLIQLMPSITLWWFLICICNIAAPPTINLIGEILLINRICAWTLLLMVPLAIMSFISAAFTLYFYSFTQHGVLNSRIYGFSTGKINEFTLFVLHWLPINLIILKAEIFIIYFNSLIKILACGAGDTKKFKVIIHFKPLICNYISISLCVIRFICFLTRISFIKNCYTVIYEFSIVNLNSIDFTYILIIDIITLVFMGTVLIIARCVVLFSRDYINRDPNINRFIWLVTIFVASIMLLILSPNMISILLGWDGLGLVSYALVIYYQNIKSYNAGMLTALSNRIGDVTILLAIALINSIGSYNFCYENDYSNPIWACVTWLICTAACTKSAQIPFSAWLPAAIAAPTPVSALVHSSTLVTAGVYLLIRFNSPILQFGVNKYLLIIATITILIAGVGANFEIDLKKIIALSTLSQLGLIILAIRLGLMKLAFFHLITHALFKALLFMCAGNVIHNRSDTQDLRKLGIICSQIPITAVCLNSANIALCGIPFIAGFYSKDLILESIVGTSSPSVIIILAYLATALTVTYSLRLRYYCMLTTCNRKSSFSLNDNHEFSVIAIIPLIILSVTGGAILNWLIIPSPIIISLSMPLKLLINVVLITGLLFALSLIKSGHSYIVLSPASLFSETIGSMWFLPTIATRFYGWNSINLGYNTTYYIDRGWTDLVSVKWSSYLGENSSTQLQFQQNSDLKFHFVTFIFWFICILLCQFICFSSLLEQSSEET